jgi:hypothetical protein
MNGPQPTPTLIAPPHPLRWVATLYFVVGGLATSCGGCTLAVLPSALSIGMIVIGIVALVLGVHFRSLFVGLPAVNFSVRLLREGRTQEAIQVVDQLPRGIMRARVVRRSAALVRGTAALHEGRVDEVEGAVADALGGSLQFLSEGAELQQRAAALSVRALARVAKGELDAALADVRAIEATNEATPHALAQARLALALSHARKGDADALGEHLKANASLLLDHSLPRERAMVRGLRRLVHARRKSVYREPARMERPSQGSLAKWAAAFVPDLSEFVTPNVLGAVAPAAPVLPITPATAPRPRRARLFVLWGVLVILFLGVWQFLTPSEKHPSRDRSESPEEVAENGISGANHARMALQMVALLALFGVAMAVVRRSHASAVTTLARGRRAIATGRIDEGERLLRGLVARNRLWLRFNGQQAALACAELARCANRRGDFTGAREHCQAGLSCLRRTSGGERGSSDIPLPTLLAERAIAHACERNPNAALADLGRIETEMPAFHELLTCRVRVRLVNGVVSADWAAALEAAGLRTADLPLPLAEDLLADVVVASKSVVAKDDRDRIAAEVNDFPEVAAWIDRLAPQLRSMMPPHPTSPPTPDR